MINRIVLNETSYFGRGSRIKLADEIRSRRYDKVLLVSDITLVNMGITKKIINETRNQPKRNKQGSRL